MVTRRCGICGERYERKRFQWANPHVASIHPVWWNWFRRWRIGFLVAVIVVPPLLVIADLATFRSGNIIPLAVANLSWVGWAQIMLFAYGLKLRETKNQWKKEQGAH
jgi:hypothetical protein